MSPPSYMKVPYNGNVSVPSGNGMQVKAYAEKRVHKKTTSKDFDSILSYYKQLKRMEKGKMVQGIKIKNFKNINGNEWKGSCRKGKNMIRTHSGFHKNIVYGNSNVGSKCQSDRTCNAKNKNEKHISFSVGIVNNNNNAKTKRSNN